MKRYLLTLTLALAACGGGGGSAAVNPLLYLLSSAETISTEVTTGGAVALARLLGTLHLLTCDAGGVLRHRAGPPAPTWSAVAATVVDASGCAGLVAVADDGFGRLHLAYVRNPGGGPEVAHAWFDGVWTIDATAFAVGAGGGVPDLVVDGSVVGLAFQDDITAARPFLAYAEWPSGTAGPWSAPAAIDASIIANMGENPSLVVLGGTLYAAHFDSTNFGVRLALCPAACTAAGNWAAGPLVAATGAELDLAANPSNGFLTLFYRDQTAIHTLALREWNPAAPFSPGPALAVMSAVGTVSPSIALRIEANGRRHVFAWTEAGGLLQLRHRYGFGIFITDGNSPFAVQNLAPLPGPLLPLLAPASDGPIEIAWAATAPLLAGAHLETRTGVF